MDSGIGNQLDVPVISMTEKLRYFARLREQRRRCGIAALEERNAGKRITGFYGRACKRLARIVVNSELTGVKNAGVNTFERRPAGILQEADSRSLIGGKRAEG